MTPSNINAVFDRQFLFKYTEIIKDLQLMVWSKLKQNIENNFCGSLVKRLKLYTTTYGSNYDLQDLYNRGWITVDGIEVVNFSTPEVFFRYTRDLNATTPTKYPANTIKKEYVHRTPNCLTEKGEFSKYDLTYCCSAFLSMSIEDAMEHESPIIQMLAVVDKRLGKRRLTVLNEKELHPLVRYFLDLRLDAKRDKKQDYLVHS